MTKFDEILERVKKDRKEKGFCLCHECTHRDAEQQWMWEEIRNKQEEMFKKIKESL